MKKIGILSLYYNNYNMGGLLQAYALQKALQKTGCIAEQVTFNYFRFYCNEPEVIVPVKRTFFQKVKNRINFYKDKYKAKKKIKIFSKRLNSFEKFMNDIPHSKAIYTSVEQFCDLYDVFIVGSDQVWGDWLPEKALKSFLMEHSGFNGKRYSYAASIGTDDINPQLNELYSNTLDKFNGLSVREHSAQTEINKLLPKKDIRIDLDPTLLLNADEWNKVAVNPRQKKKYIFCYYLGKEKKYRTETTLAAKKLGLPIVTLPYIKDNRIENFDNDFGNIRDFKSGPADFIGLIKNAELVITDSYHAMIFSCLFQKNFYILKRENKEVRSTNSRIHDFLIEFNLENRFITTEKLYDISLDNNVDFNTFNSLIDKLRESSYNYLRKIAN